MPPRDGDDVHELTLAVWDLPSPVVTGRPLALKVGAKCSHDCDLTGAPVEIRNDAEAVVGSGTLGPTPWAGTSALYWTGVELTGPDPAGPACLTASIAAVEGRLHPIASSTFRFVVVNPPEHVVTLRAARLGAHRADMELTDARSLVPAQLASTGQQKALLIGVVLGHAALIAAARGAPPMLLLDEPAVHLDADHRAALCAALLRLDGPILVTGTDAEAYGGLRGAAGFWTCQATGLEPVES